MGHFLSQQTIPLDTAPMASQALRVALREFYDDYTHGDSRETSFEHYPYGTVFTLRKAYELADDIWEHTSQTSVIPIAQNAQDASSERVVKFSVDGDAYRAYQRVENPRTNPHQVIEALGIALPKTLAGRINDIVEVNITWDITSKLIGGNTEGKVVKKFWVHTESTDEDGWRNATSVRRHLVGHYDSQAEANAAIRKVASTLDVSGLAFSVRSINVREEGTEDLSQFRAVVSKAKGEATFTLVDRTKSKQDGWLVSFDYHD